MAYKKTKYTYGERKAFGRGVKCGFAKKCKAVKRRHKRNYAKKSTKYSKTK